MSRIPMANVDPRHNGQFGAAWTLAYAATVASAGLEVLTLSTLARSFGLIAGQGEPVAEGGFRPLAQVVARLGALAGETCHAVETSRPDAVLGLGAPGKVLLANITAEMQRVALGRAARSVTLIGADAVDVAAGDTLELGAYGCAEVVFG